MFYFECPFKFVSINTYIYIYTSKFVCPDIIMLFEQPPSSCFGFYTEAISISEFFFWHDDDP